MKVLKSFNLFQVIFKSLITILLVIFLVLEITVVKNIKWFEITIAVCSVVFLTFVIQTAVEYPITGSSCNLAIIPIALLFLPLINQSNKKAKEKKIENSSLEPSSMDIINSNRLKISYLIACITIRTILNLLLVLILLWNSVEIYWILVFAIFFTVEIVIDIYITTEHIRQIVRQSKIVADRSAVIEK